MKKLVVALLLCMTMATYAQKKSDLYGFWQFDRLTEDTSVKDTAQANTLFRSMWMRFYPDGNYESGIMKTTETGTYTLNGTIIDISGRKENPYNLLAAQPDRLTIKLGKHSFYMKRKPVEANVLKLSKNWKLTKIVAPADEDEDDDEAGEENNTLPVPKGSIAMNANGTYSMSIAGTAEKGYWDWREQKDGKLALITETGGKAKYWPVVNLSDTEMVLNLSSNGQQFIFTAQ